MRRLQAGGPGGGPSDSGRALHAHIEARTDELATPPYTAAGKAVTSRLEALLDPIAAAVIAGQGVPYPNPMAVPPPQ